MKGNKTFIIIFSVLLVLYVIAQLYEPKKFDWTLSLRNNDNNPFGAVIPYTELKQLFPGVNIQSHRIPAYNVLHDKDETSSAYILLEPEFNPDKADLEELLGYVKTGNTVFLSAFDFDKKFLDTLGLKMKEHISLLDKDSTTINFVNPALKAPENYTFKNSTIDGYFDSIKKFDSSVVLGVNQNNKPNFVKVQFGKGEFLIHAAPICFSNYFMLYNNNSEYTAKALSYISPAITTLHWDEYYKSGREGASTPLRFFLSNTFLKWALWLTVAALLIYVFFEMKRRQRIIPVIEPLRNTTLDFVETVSSVYYSQHDNSSIAKKKSQFWFDHIRQRYYLSTNNTDDSFVQQLQRKSGVPAELIRTIISNIQRAEIQPKVTDDLLLALSSSIDEFYKLSKI
ncbi:MAG TPA: hypothetical protein PLP23_09560 [Panacibacter sp.]|nr:hypothetical protein [Panacibacter sp.]